MTAHAAFRRISIVVCSSLVAALSVSMVRADAIVITKAMTASTVAEFFVEDNSVRVILEIGANDIEAFRNILPDEFYDKFKFADALPYEERIEQLFSQDLVILGDQMPLAGKVLELTVRKRIRRDEITGAPLGEQPADGETVVYAELEYQLRGKPETITIQPVRNPEHGRVAANIGFITYHRGLPVMDFRYLSQNETLELDWEDPWYSKFRNRNLWRQFDAPLSMFLYVEPFEVRVELVARPVDLHRWTDLGIRTNGTILISEQSALKSRVIDFLSDKIDVSINGEKAHGTLDRIHFISRTLRKTGVVYPDQDLDTSSATLGVIFVFPVPDLPDSVTAKWRLFDEKITAVPVVATDEAGGLPSTLTPEDPVLAWKNYLTNPTIPAMLAIESPPVRPQVSIPWASLGLLAVGCLAGLRLRKTSSLGSSGIVLALLIFALGGAAWLWPRVNVQIANPIISQRQINDQQATDITRSLMHNLYHSFDRREESVVYDQLATCVAGDLLREIYIQIMQRISLVDQGGAQVKVDDVEVVEAEFDFREDSPGFDSVVKWNVIGTVGHWGHLHSRANQYVAEFGVQPVDGAWKIVSMQITNEADLGTKPIN